MSKHAHPDTQSVVSILASHNVTATAPRKAILQVLMNAQKPYSIDEIEKKVKGNANYVTLYRVLKLFSDKGIVYQTDFREGKAFYEFQGEHHHHHITCIVCGCREHIPQCDESHIRNISQKSKQFKTISNHTLEFFGICTSCDRS
jgi:Fe2+ or Zn2+ uptake regulation protein